MPRYAQNANIFSKRVSGYYLARVLVTYPDHNTCNCKMAAIRKLCGKDIDLGMYTSWLLVRQHVTSNNSSDIRKLVIPTVFIDGPHLLQPADLPWSSASELGASEMSDSDPSLAPRAWWQTNEARTQAVGLNASLASLRDILKATRYEVRLHFFFRSHITLWLNGTASESGRGYLGSGIV